MSIDIILIGIFLVGNLCAGFSSERSVKTIKDYALGGKKFTTSTLVATIIATCYGGGSLMLGLENTYHDGLYFGLVLIFGSFFALIIGQIYAPRMGEFIGNISVAESMGQLYGPRIRLATSFFSLLRAIGGAALEFKVITHVAGLFGYVGHGPMFIAAIMVIGYSSFGGIRAITFTDVMQFIAFGLCISLLVVIFLLKLPNPIKDLSRLASHPNFDITQVVSGGTRSLTTFFLILSFMIPGLFPTQVQRIYMAKSTNQARCSFSYAAGIALIITLLLVFGGALLFVHNTSVPSGQLLQHITTTYHFPGLIGVLSIGVIALMMSSADSELNAAAVIIGHDIPAVLGNNNNNNLLWARLGTVVLGAFALLLAMYVDSLLVLALIGYSVYMPIVGAPFSFAIFGFRPQEKSVWWGMGVGFFTVLIWDFFISQWIPINGLIPAMVANLIALVGSHYILPQVPHTGWVGIQGTDELLLDQQERERTRRKVWHAINNFKVATYFRSLLPLSNASYGYLGVYLLVTNLVALVPVMKHGEYESYIPYCMIAMGVGMFFLTYPTYAANFSTKNIGITWGWVLGIFIFLFFMGAANFFAYGYAKIHRIIWLTHVIVGAMLLPFHVVIPFIWGGFQLAYLFFYTDHTTLSIWGKGHGRFSYTLIAFGALLLIIVKLQKNKNYLIKKVQLLKKIQLEKEYTQLQTLKYQQVLDNYIMKKKGKGEGEEDILPNLKTVIDARKKVVLDAPSEILFHQSIDSILSIPTYLQERAYYQKNHRPLQVSVIEMGSFLEEVIAISCTMYPKVRILLKGDFDSLVMHGDGSQYKNLFINSISLLMNDQKDEESIIKVQLLPTKLRYELANHLESSERKQIDGIAITITKKKEIGKEVAQEYIGNLDGTVLTTPTTVYELAKRENERIIDAHYGYCKQESNPIPDTYFYVVPRNITLIRSKIMDQLPLDPNGVVLNTEYSEQLERELVRALQEGGIVQEGVFDLEILSFIKKCHGMATRHYSQEPSYTFSFSVVQVLLQITRQPETIIAALLQGITAVANIPMSYLRCKYGYDVVRMVAYSSPVSYYYKKINHGDRSVYSHLELWEQNFEPELAYLKLAKRLVNLRSEIPYELSERKNALLEETEQYYIPFARDIKQFGIAEEMLEICQKLKA